MRILSAAAILVAANAFVGGQGVAQTLAEQSACAERADRLVHQQLGWNTPITQQGTDQYSVSYVTHYNVARKKCFVLLMTTAIAGRAVGTTSKDLLDAFENRAYALYLWMPREDENRWEGPPAQCSLMPPAAALTRCSSVGEFDAFVKTYME